MAGKEAVQRAHRGLAIPDPASMSNTIPTGIILIVLWLRSMTGLLNVRQDAVEFFERVVIDHQLALS